MTVGWFTCVHGSLLVSGSADTSNLLNWKVKMKHVICACLIHFGWSKMHEYTLQRESRFSFQNQARANCLAILLLLPFGGQIWQSSATTTATKSIQFSKSARVNCLAILLLYGGQIWQSSAPGIQMVGEYSAPPHPLNYLSLHFSHSQYLHRIYQE